MRVRSRDLVAQAQSQVDRAQAIAVKLPGSLLRTLDWLPAGSSNGSGPKTSGGDHSSLDGKLDDYGNRRSRDKHAAYIQAVIADLRDIDRAQTRLEATLRKLDVMDAEEARKLAEAADVSKGSECQNPACKAWITGGENDRSKEGRCPRCYEYRQSRKREGRPLEDRPHRLVHRTPMLGCADCERVHGMVTG